MRTQAKQRGFSTFAKFIRNFLMRGAVDVVPNEEIFRRSRNSDVLHKKGALPKLASLAEMIEL